MLTAGLCHLAFIAMKRNQLMVAHEHATQSLSLYQQSYPNKHRKIVDGMRVDHPDEIVCVVGMFACVCCSTKFASQN